MLRHGDMLPRYRFRLPMAQRYHLSIEKVSFMVSLVENEVTMVNLDDPGRVWGKLKSTDWNAEAKNLLKSELKRRGVTYAQLCALLEKMGVSETEANLKNRISRGGFSLSFFLQCMAAIGQDSVFLGRHYVIEVEYL